MRVYRDDYGIPHLRAASVDELAHLQGRITARDRGRQLEVDRRRSQGLLAELIGPAGLGWDRFARRARIDDTARGAYARLDERTRRWLEAYADGVEAGGVGWRPWSSLGVFLARHILFASFPGKMFNAHVERTLGPGAVGWFSAEAAGESGSNAWATAREIAGDPHRLIELPGVYQQIRLACPEFDVAGLAFPGVPGVQHFGHTGSVAWAVTNAMADYQDLYVEQIRRTDAGVEVRGPAGWEPAAVHTETIPVRGGAGEVVEVVETARGPIVDQNLSLRTPTRAGLELGFAALLPLLHASTVDDVSAAFRHWVEPVNSVLTADTGGRLLQLTAGRVPVRDDRNRRVPVPAWEPRYAWREGYLPMLCTEVDGSAVNANDRRPDTEPYGVSFASPARARRIRELLDAGTPAERIHMDTTMPADSVEAGRYAAWRTAVARRLHDHPALAPLREPSGYDPLFSSWTDPLAQIGTRQDGVLAGLGLAAADLVDPAGIESGTWGSRHLLEPVRLAGLTASVPRTELGGERDSVLCTSSIPGVTDLCSRGPVARYVWDVADRSRSRWVVPFGAADDPESPHFADQLPRWAAGELVALVEDWSRLHPEDLS